jgi:hypothetical protein
MQKDRKTLVWALSALLMVGSLAGGLVVAQSRSHNPGECAGCHDIAKLESCQSAGSRRGLFFDRKNGWSLGGQHYFDDRDQDRG